MTKITGMQHNAGVVSYTNTGTAGGTFYYSNFGGVKRLWGVTASKAVSGSGFASASYVINLPSGFFTNLRSIQATSASHTNTQYMFPAVNLASTSAVSFHWIQVNGTNGSCTMFVEIIGD